MDPGGEVKKQGLEPIEILRSRPLSIGDGPLYAGITDDHRMGLEAPTSMKCPIHRAAKEQVLGCSGDTLQGQIIMGCKCVVFVYTVKLDPIHIHSIVPLISHRCSAHLCPTIFYCSRPSKQRCDLTGSSV